MIFPWLTIVKYSFKHYSRKQLFLVQAKTPEDAEKGLLFMKEIVELSKSQVATSIAELQAVFYKKESGGIELLMAGPSHFSKELTGNESIQRKSTYAEPFRLCSPLKTPIEKIKDRILIVERGDCTFIDKVNRQLVCV